MHLLHAGHIARPCLVLAKSDKATARGPVQQSPRDLSLERRVEVREREVPAQNQMKWPIRHLVSYVLLKKLDRRSQLRPQDELIVKRLEGELFPRSR